MKEYASTAIRNVAVVGHGGSGKTSLVDALAFVAAIQVEFLFEGAKDPKALREALNTRVKALAVGRVTADALREWGVKPFYVDETERLGSLLQGFKRALQKEVA